MIFLKVSLRKGLAAICDLVVLDDSTDIHARPGKGLRVEVGDRLLTRSVATDLLKCLVPIVRAANKVLGKSDESPLIIRETKEETAE